MKRGPDPSFPYLDENARFTFPRPEESDRKSIIAWGGNLSPGMLLSAYEQGLFPWYNEDDPILWQSPDPRFVIFPENLHISQSMKKTLRRKTYTVTFDEDFEGVIKGCAEAGRPGQDGTWITGDIIAAYTELHRLGWAHSAEAWLPAPPGEPPERRVLAGGCYGIRLGSAFFGESMFARADNASKTAFLTLGQRLFEDGVVMIDCQVYTSHLESLGGTLLSRKNFIALLRKTLEPRKTGNADALDRRGGWQKAAAPAAP